MLRITGGKYRNRNVEKPKNRELRPTTSLVRESVFNQLQTKIVDARFLDCFAGTGLMGLEALSRGAKFVLALDSNKTHCRIAQKNFEQFGLTDDVANAVNKDAVEVFSKRNKREPFDIAYVDPPYGFGGMESFIDKLIANGWLTADGIIFVEQGIRDTALDGFEHREYGDTRLSIKRLG